jgi:hypothetical protein
MLIDCDHCGGRPQACADCVVSLMLDAPSGPLELDDLEERAVATLADGGLLPPLRLVPLRPSRGRRRTA